MAQTTAQVGNLNITTQVLPATNTIGSAVPSVKNFVPVIGKKFKKIPVKALSSVLMLTGITQLCFGIMMYSAESNQLSLTVRSGVSLWAGLVVLIAGFASLIALLKDSVNQIKFCMVCNIANITVAATGLILYAIQIHIETQTCWTWARETDTKECNNYYSIGVMKFRIAVNVVIILFSLLGLVISCVMTKASDKALKASGYSLLR